MQAKRPSPSSASLRSGLDSGPCESWGRGEGEGRGPSRRGRIWNWELGPSSGPRGRKAAADGSPRGSRDPGPDPAAGRGEGGWARQRGDSVSATLTRRLRAASGGRGREGLPGQRSRYLRGTEVLAAASRPRSPGPRGTRRALATRARVPQGALVAAARRGVPGREEGSSSRGRAACGGGLAWRPGASPDPIRLLSASPGDGADSPSWQGLSHRDAPAPGLGRGCILTSLGSPGPGAGPRPPPRVGGRGRGGHCLQGAPTASLCPLPD